MEANHAAKRMEFYEMVHLFVDHFFGCEECRLEFLEILARSEESRRATPANIWFYQIHNNVTARVYKG